MKPLTSDQTQLLRTLAPLFQTERVVTTERLRHALALPEPRFRGFMGFLRQRSLTNRMAKVGHVLTPKGAEVIAGFGGEPS